MSENKLVYKRKDGRWEARYKKGIGPNGRAIYGAVYAATREEVEQKRDEKIAELEHMQSRTQLNLLILGAGSLGNDVKEIAESLRVFQKIHFLDDHAEGDDIIGTWEDAKKLRGEYACAFVAIGDNRKRQHMIEKLMEINYLLPKIISPTAVVSRNATIGDGTVIMAQANIGAAEIGNGCIVAAGCNISSDTVINNYSRIDTAGVVPKGENVPSGTWVTSGEVYTGNIRLRG